MVLRVYDLVIYQGLQNHILDTRVLGEEASNTLRKKEAVRNSVYNLHLLTLEGMKKKK